MANALFTKGKANLLRNDINVLGNNIKIMLIDLADYTFDDADQYVADVAAGSIIGRSANLANKTVSDGAAFDSDPAVVSVVTGDQFEAFIMYQDTGSDATSRLIMFQDTGVTGLPITPDGSDVRITPNASGWFAL